MIVSNARKEIQKARNIRKSLGLKVAAKYLKNRGWSVEAAVWILLGA
jgi:hypothetical protein